MQWTTADGRTLNIPELEDTHLLNAHRYISEEIARFKNIQMLRIMGMPTHSDPRQVQKKLDTSIRGKRHLEEEINRRGLTPFTPRKLAFTEKRKFQEGE